MKTVLKRIALMTMLVLTFSSCVEDKNTETKSNDVAVDTSAEVTAVTSVMKTYKEAIQSLTTEGTANLFTKEAKVFEGGSAEGTYEEYASHHLGPELDYLESFIFSDYTIDVEVEIPFAFTTESFTATLTIKADEEGGTEPKIIKLKIIATSILIKADNKWKIIKTHSSSRSFSKSSH